MNEKKSKVLIVDDEPRNQRIITEVLEELVEFRLASSGEEALRIADEFAPDLVLLDIMMPGIDGYEVCRKLKGDPKHELAKVLLVSGKAMVEERLKGYEAGADDYMTKPFVPEELLAKTKVFLRLTRVERELLALNRSLDEQIRERTKSLLEAEGRLIGGAKMSALGEMAGGIAHEINTPLGTIALLLEQVSDLVKETPVDHPAVAKRLRTANDTVRRIAQIISGLRTFSRDGTKDPFDDVSANQIIADTISLCGEKLKSAGIELRRDPSAEDHRVRCRAVQISQVLLNLVGNACDAIQSLPEKWIRISVERDADRVRISVTDSGNGVPAEVRARLFQPFFTTKAIGKGTGLGLSVSKGILDAHSGTIALDPDCKHTRFVFTLPVAEASSADRAA